MDPGNAAYRVRIFGEVWVILRAGRRLTMTKLTSAPVRLSVSLLERVMATD